MLRTIEIAILTFIASIVLFLYFLFNGIYIDTLDIFNTKISNIYIKYDKKFVFVAKNIVIQKTKDVTSDYKQQLNNVKIFLKYFQFIKIYSINYNNKQYFVKYNNNTITLTTNIDKDNIIKAKIDILKDKKLNIKLVHFNIPNKTSYFKGDIKSDIELSSFDIDANIFYKNNIFSLKGYTKPDNLYKLYVKSFYIKNQDLLFDGIVSINPKQIYSTTNFNLEIENFNFRFNKKLKLLKAKKVSLVYKNNDISLNLQNPIYDNISLDGSKVIIKNIVSNSKQLLKLTLKPKALLQEKALDILKFYNIHLPFYQQTGNNDITINIDIPFNKQKIKIGANIKSTNTKIEIDNKIIFLTKMDIILHPNQTLDMQLFLKDTNDIKVDAKVNINNHLANGIIYLNHFNYQNIVDVKKKKYNFIFDFSKKEMLKLELPKYNLTYIKKDTTHTIDFKYEKTKVKIITKNDFKITNIDLSNININLQNEQLLKLFHSNHKQAVSFIIDLHNSSLQHKKYKFHYKYAHIYNKGSKIFIKVLHNSTNIIATLDSKEDKITIKSKHINYSLFNDFLGKQFLDAGDIQLDAKGTFKKMKGKLLLTNTIVANQSFLNNLIAVINTTPALINPIFALPTLFRMGQTNFDFDRYHISKGWIDFDYNIKQELFHINDSLTKSNLIDFKLKGDLDLKHSSIKLDANAIFMKDYAKFIKYIPLIGYLTTDKKGNISTEIKIFGDLENPQFKFD